MIEIIKRNDLEFSISFIRFPLKNHCENNNYEGTISIFYKNSDFILILFLKKFFESVFGIFNAKINKIIHEKSIQIGILYYKEIYFKV